MKLVDLNLLLYAVNADSPQHERAKAWLERSLAGAERVALPWVVIVGFLRIATRPAAFARPLSVGRAVDLIESWLSQQSVVVLAPGEQHWSILRRLVTESGTAGNLTTDAHLAAMAIEYECELCSTDSDFARYEGLHWTNPLGSPRSRSRGG